MALGRLPFLASLAQSDRMQDRLIWLRVALDYAAELGEDAEFEDAFLERFVETLDMAGPFARLDAARRLAHAPAPPANLLSILSAYGGEAAAEILVHAPYLPQDAAASALSENTQARLLARRDDLDSGTVDALIELNDPETWKALAANASPILKGPRLARLVRFAREAEEGAGDRCLVEALLQRNSSQPEAVALFLFATPAQRSSMLLTAQRAELGRPRPGDQAEVASPYLEELEAHALAGCAEAFVETLARALGCAPALAARIAADKSGEALVVALAALAAPGDVGVRILTSSDMRDGSDYRRVGVLARLQNSLNPAAARRIVAAMIGGSMASEPEVAPASATNWRPGDRRLRAAPAVLRDDPASLRRRRAFTMLAENRKL